MQRGREGERESARAREREREQEREREKERENVCERECERDRESERVRVRVRESLRMETVSSHFLSPLTVLCDARAYRCAGRAHAVCIAAQRIRRQPCRARMV